MSRNIETILEEKIIQRSEEMDKYPIGSEEQEVATRDYMNLMDVNNNIMKIRAEEAKNYDSIELETKKLELEMKKFEYEKKRDEESSKTNFWMWIGDKGIYILGGISMVAVNWAFATTQVFPFEQTGVPTSSVWRNGLLSNLKFFKH